MRMQYSHSGSLDFGLAASRTAGEVLCCLVIMLLVICCNTPRKWKYFLPLSLTILLCVPCYLFARCSALWSVKTEFKCDFFQCPAHSIPLIREESEHLSNPWHFCSDVLHFWDRLYSATPSVLSCTEKAILLTFLYASLWLHCYKKHYKHFRNNFKLNFLRDIAI